MWPMSHSGGRRKLFRQSLYSLAALSPSHRERCREADLVSAALTRVETVVKAARVPFKPKRPEGCRGTNTRTCGKG